MTYIFTEAFNCGELLPFFLKSYFKYHKEPINIVLSNNDIEMTKDSLEHPLVNVVNVSNMPLFSEMWDSGHAGTALSFAYVITNLGKNQNVIHFDSDVIFTDNCIDEIIQCFEQGYSLVGPTRPYKNNLNNRTDLNDLPDLISTYCFGVDTRKIPNYDLNNFVQMCRGFYDPTGKPVLDFFDPVSRSVIENNGRVKYLNHDDYGGLNEHGSKDNGFKSNQYIDFGNKLMHFAGVGSGCAVEKGRATKCHAGYGEWASKRWKLYSKIFIDCSIELDTERTKMYDTIIKESNNDIFTNRTG